MPEAQTMPPPLSPLVIPAQAGIQLESPREQAFPAFLRILKLDPRLRRNDEEWSFHKAVGIIYS